MKYRTFGLHQSVRSLLIIIDGVSTVEKLLGYTAQLHDAEETLSWLIQEGFVEGVSPTQPAPHNTSTSLPQAAPIEKTGKLALIALTREILGADAAKVLKRLDDVPDTQNELIMAADKCYKFIKLTIDENKAHQYLKASQALLSKLS